MLISQYKIVLLYKKQFQSLAIKWYPKKAKMNKRALTKQKCLNPFETILKVK